MRARLGLWVAVLVIGLGMVLLASGMALASWLVDSGPRPLRAVAAQVGAGPTPVAVGPGLGAREVALNWPPVRIAGHEVTGYRIHRHPVPDGEIQPAGAGCAGLVTTTNCVERDVPDGVWSYTVTVVQGARWAGAPGPPSSPVTVSAQAPTVELTFPVHRGVYGVSGFAAGCATDRADLCGRLAVSAAAAGHRVGVSVRRTSNGKYWNPATGAFTASAEKLLPAEQDAAGGWSLPFAVLNFGAAGRYTIRVEVVDAFGRTGQARVTVTVHPQQPAAPRLDGRPADPDPSGSATVGFHGPGTPVTFQCALDGVAFSGCASPVSYRGLADGRHTVAVRAVDPGGNLSPATTWNWRVDSTPPRAVDVQARDVLGAPAGRLSSGDTITFSYSEAIGARSVVAGWSGAPYPVTVEVADGQGGPDVLTVRDGGSPVPALGRLVLGDAGYVGPGGVHFAAVLTRAADGRSLAVVLGVPSDDTAPGRVTRPGTMRWSPGPVADVAGNPLAVSARGPVEETRQGAPDVEF